MDKNILDQAEDLLDDAAETSDSKKQFAKTMKATLKECAEKNNIDKKSLTHIKDYYYYQGKNWLNGDPLLKDKEAKQKDKISPTFIKLLEIFEDLEQIGDIGFLKPYTDALLTHGIKIEFDAAQPTTNDSLEVIKGTLQTACKYQTNIDTLNEQLKEESAKQAEDIGFVPKGTFMKVLSTYEKIKAEKNVEDDVQKNIEKSLMVSEAYQYLSSKIKRDEDDNAGSQTLKNIISNQNR